MQKSILRIVNDQRVVLSDVDENAASRFNVEAARRDVAALQQIVKRQDAMDADDDADTELVAALGALAQSKEVRSFLFSICFF